MSLPLHQATLLGLLEGLTEFLPVSSTGHLILVSRLLRLHGQAIDTFDIVIQAGALGAVLGLYRKRVAAMWRGLWGEDVAGRRLLTRLFFSFLPAAVVGLTLHRAIKSLLFNAWPVVVALGGGGVVMIAMDQWLKRRAPSGKTLEAITPVEALMIGCAQCLALWPGMSRSMVTILAGLLLGWPSTLAAEYSFLLALPTLGAATLFDAATNRHALVQQIGGLSIACGFVVAGLVAALAMRGFLQYLTRRGLAPFGWYRVGLAVVAWYVLLRA